MANDKLKVAIVHDFLIYHGGAERVIKEIAGLFPAAPVFTLLARDEIASSLPGNIVIPSFLNRISYVLPHRLLLPFYPIAAESIDLREYDLVISSTSSFMKGVVVKPRTLHLCYCHTPTRFLWDLNEQYLQDVTGDNLLAPGKRFFGRLFLNYLRMWDQTASKRVDIFLANSHFTAERIKKYYQRKAKIIYPPVHTENFSPNNKKGKYFLVVSRLSAYKRIDLVVEAFNRLGWPLIIAGVGREKRKLQKKARANIRFVGFVNEKSLPRLYSGCRALIFPGEDDFGITMVEAMASGKPVLAYGEGGALEIVEEGKTGEFFKAPEVEILVDGLRRLVENEKNYSADYIRKSAKRFSVKNFRKNFMEVVNKSVTKLAPSEVAGSQGSKYAK
ncbi:MAG: glycosyltransferase [Candidatus Moraniibacteriota bacterium]